MKQNLKTLLMVTVTLVVSAFFVSKGCAAGSAPNQPSLSLVKETVLQLEAPVVRVNAAQPLPNGHFVLDYVAVHSKSLDPNVPYEEFVALTDSDGNVVWQMHDGFLDEAAFSMSEGYKQLIVNPHSFTYESYLDVELNTFSWVEQGWDGAGIDFSKALCLLTDGEKRLVTNLYPFRVDSYVFGEQANDRVLLMNLLNGTEAEIAPGSSCFLIGSTIFALTEQEGAPYLSIYDDRCVKIADRILPVTHTAERVAGVFQCGADACVLTAEYLEHQVTWRAYAVDAASYVPSRTAFEYVEERKKGDYLSPLCFFEEGFVFVRNEWDGQQLMDGQLIYLNCLGEITALEDIQMGVVAHQTNEKNGQITLLGYDLPGQQCVVKTYVLNNL